MAVVGNKGYLLVGTNAPHVYVYPVIGNTLPAGFFKYDTHQVHASIVYSIQPIVVLLSVIANFVGSNVAPLVLSTASATTSFVDVCLVVHPQPPRLA